MNHICTCKLKKLRYEQKNVFFNISPVFAHIGLLGIIHDFNTIITITGII